VGYSKKQLMSLNMQLCVSPPTDADLYSSVLFATTLVSPKLSKGAVILYDDYGFRTCGEAKAKIDEFFARESAESIFLTTGQCLVLKR
jgi:hypothetical protein